jgi:hypothetical protein
MKKKDNIDINFNSITAIICKGKESKAIHVTGCGGPQGCQTSRLPHFLDSQLTDGSEVVSITCQLPL